MPDDAGAPPDLTTCCPLDAYAGAKRLPIEFLRELGVEEFAHRGRSRLRIPYRNPDGSLFRYRIRRALFKPEGGKDGRVLWDRQPKGTGDKVKLYGLEHLPVSGEQLILVEGESDAHTLWFHGIHALGVPGASSFSAKRDDTYLGRFARIIAVQEPDAGGVTFVGGLLKSDHRDHICVARLDGFKDVSDMHVADPAHFGERLAAAIAKVVPLNAWAGDSKKAQSDASAAAAKLPPSDEEAEQEIARLVKLSPLQYARQREDTAKKLGLGVGILDRLVASERKNGAEIAGQGRPIQRVVRVPWEVPVDGAALLDDLATAVLRHVRLNTTHAWAVALWLLARAGLTAFYIFPRLFVTAAAPDSGKTTLLETVETLTETPINVSHATMSPLFRAIELLQPNPPTILLDEADTYLRDDENLRALINAGHKRNGAVMRSVGDDHEPRLFSAFAPAAIAGIGGQHPTIESRSLIIRLSRKLPGETVAPLRGPHLRALEEIASKGVRWAQDNMTVLVNAEPKMPAELNNRASDNWRPLFIVADVAGGEWPARVRAAAAAMVAEDAAEAEQTPGIQVLADIRDIFDAKDKTAIFSQALVEELQKKEGRPWAEWGKARKPISKNALARLLKPFRVRPKDIRIGQDHGKGYERAQFDDAWRRHLPARGDSNRDHATTLGALGTLADSNRDNGGCGVTDENPRNPLVEAECRGVADGIRGEAAKTSNGGLSLDHQKVDLQLAAAAEIGTDVLGRLWKTLDGTERIAHKERFYEIHRPSAWEADLRNATREREPGEDEDDYDQEAAT